MKTQITNQRTHLTDVQPEITNQKEKRILKTKCRIAALSLLAILCLTAAAAPASAQCAGTQLFNKQGDGDLNADTMNFGYALSNSFTVNASSATCFTFLAWEYPGDKILSLYWSIDSNYGGTQPNNTHSASAIALGPLLSDRFVSTNAYGYDLDEITVTIPATSLAGGQHYLSLSYAMTVQNLPVFWDDCHQVGCSPAAYQAYFPPGGWGSISPDSDTFAIYGK